MYRRILVAVNDNERAFKALAHAFELADKMSAQLFVIFVFKKNTNKESQQEISLAEQNLKEKIRDIYPNIAEKADFISKKGKNVAALIVEEAEENEIDLIVMGSRRLPGANSVIRRSIANAVMSSCQKPVLII